MPMLNSSYQADEDQASIQRAANIVNALKAFADFRQGREANKINNETNIINAFRAGLRPIPQNQPQFGSPVGINGEAPRFLTPEQRLRNPVTPGPTPNQFQSVATIGGQKMYADPSGVGTAVYSFNPSNGAFEQIATVGKGSIVRNQLSPQDYAERENAKYGADTKVADRAMSLRGEFNQIPTVKEYQTIKGQVSAMQDLVNAKIPEDLKNSRLAQDQGVITLFNKVTDPTSVVRESEYDRTPKNLSLANRFEGAYQKLVSGGAGLTQEDRESLLFGAKAIADARGRQYNEIYNDYIDTASRYGVSDSKMIVGAYRPHKNFLNSQEQSQVTVYEDPDKEARYQEWKAKQLGGAK